MECGIQGDRGKILTDLSTASVNDSNFPWNYYVLVNTLKVKSSSAGTEPHRIARIAVDVPGAMGFDYRVPSDLEGQVLRGSWVLVPWGRARRVGLVTQLLEHSEVSPEKLRDLLSVIADAPAPDPAWFELLEFAARYYHRGFGEVALPAVPKLFRSPPSPKARGSAFHRARVRAARLLANAESVPVSTPPALTAEQRVALDALVDCGQFAVHLLHGVTGSGKTEVYLHWLAAVLQRSATAQVLLLVPEIALTPQLIRQIEQRFSGEPVAVLHSELADGERAAHWLAAAEGRVRVIVGTRLAILTPLPGLSAIVVDEEHDASYKQQEGVRYSARDLAVALAQQRRIPIVLGSATPSLESWLAARRGRYRLLSLPNRVGGGVLPALHLIEPQPRQLRHGLMPQTVEAISDALARNQQALVFLNRRGYAPVLGCEACGWLSQCDHCSAYRVLHREGRPNAAQRPQDAAQSVPLGSKRTGAPGRPSSYRLVCHHCAAEGPVPHHCPECGNVDLKPVGRGTQRIEEGLSELFAGARIARVDRDVARRRHAARQAIDAAHAGEVDILVGTQMLAKGHDFRRLSVVAALDVDGALFSADFRAPERLFALMMQVSGRAGRGAQGARVIVQTRFGTHPLFAALTRHDYDGFADRLLTERQEAGLPPFMFLALLRAEAPVLQTALDFLAQAVQLGRSLASGPADGVAASAQQSVQVFDAVPMPMMRVAGKERAQLLIESPSRPVLHAFIDTWQSQLDAIRTPVRWTLEVDPQEI